MNHEAVTRPAEAPRPEHVTLRRLRTILRQVMLAGLKPSQMPLIVEALREINMELGEI